MSTTPRFLRKPDILGQAEITPQQAAENRARGEGPKRPRPAIAGILPVSPATFHRMVRRGDLPAPVHLTPGVSVWDEHELSQALAKLRAAR